MTAITFPRTFSTTARILLCTRNPAALYELLSDADNPSRGIEGAEIDTAEDVPTAAARLGARPFDLCLVDATWDDDALAQLATSIHTARQSTLVLQLTDRDDAVALKFEPTEGLPWACVETISLSSPPACVRKLLQSALHRARLSSENRSLKRQLQVRVVSEIIGQSDAAQQLRETIAAAAEEDGCVLIHAQPGAGSRQVARVVHLASRRALRPFLVLDCRVHSAESFERELLGDSSPGRDGSLELGRLASAAGGTLLLKNIELLPHSAQKKLAGILARKAFPCPLTGKTRPVDVRVMASAHVDLAIEVQGGRFPVALYESLTACSICVPSLSERVQDMGLLAEHILNQLAVAEGKPVKRLTVEALKALRAHDWPGNLRELQNVIERACSLDHSSQLTAEMVAPWIARSGGDQPQEAAALSLREMERKLIETTFARCRGNRELTARLLKIGLRTLSGKLREYGYPPRGGPGSKGRLAKAA